MKSMSDENNKSQKPSLSNAQTPWFSTTELLEYLGISNSELMNQFSLFTEGIHYKYEKTNNSNSKILWRVDLVDELLCVPIPPLEKEAMLNAINNRIICNE